MLRLHEEVIQCFDKALELDPHSVNAWYNKALTEDKLSHWREAAVSYQRFLTLVAAQQYAKPIECARKRCRNRMANSMYKNTVSSLSDDMCEN